VTRHSERRVVGYTPRQMFDLVADVTKYPEFLPWCTAARLRRRESPTVEIDELAIGFGPFRERFVSRVVTSTDDPALLRIQTTGVEGPFRLLSSDWTFRPNGQGSEVAFSLEFEFRSLLLQKTMQMLFAEAVRRMVSAFEARARQLYGEASAPPATPASTAP
jgi:coenzyme Q-binding protein COQ10